MKKEKWWENWKLPEDISDLTILTEHPPKCNPPKSNISQEELNKIPAHIKITPNYLYDNALIDHLFQRATAFKKTTNPIYAIEAFLIAHDAGLYPPMWVLNYMAEIFNDWHELQGTKSLDELFELKPIPGQARLYKTDKEERRDEQLCGHVYLLKTLFDFTIEEASYMASRRLEETPNWNKTQFDLKAITDYTIQDRYYKKWGKIYSSLYPKEDIIMTKEEKIEFLKQFPKDSFPTKKGKTLKEMLNKIQ